jgi:hypothetical protein
MALDFARSLYLPCFAQFARPVTITPIASQPNAAPYAARGVFDTERITFESLEGEIFSETHTTLDILEFEFSVLPQQDDRVSIPFHEGVRGGEYIVSDRSAAGNAGGQTTLTLRKVYDMPRILGGSLVLAAPVFGRPRLEI